MRLFGTPEYTQCSELTFNKIKYWVGTQLMCWHNHSAYVATSSLYIQWICATLSPALASTGLNFNSWVFETNTYHAYSDSQVDVKTRTAGTF